jgi:photosystem II stability/assembly factor-like uncharacterized protein
MKKLSSLCAWILITFICSSGQNPDIWIKPNVNFGSISSERLFQKVYFVDSLRGWVADYNGVLLRTDDGGAKWDVISIFNVNNLNSVFFTDRLNGYLVGHKRSGTKNPEKGDDCLIVRSEDGGETWKDVSPDTDFRTCSLRDVFFLNASEGWAVGEVQLFNEELVTGVVFHTTNAGRNWTSNLISNNTTRALSSVKFASSKKGWAAGDGGIIQTTNGGRSWSLGFENSEIDFYDVEIYEGIIWAVGSYGTIITRADQGKTWRQISLSNGLEKFWFSRIKFADDKRGWMVGGFGGKTVILSTNDGGTTWISENTEGINGFLNSVEATDKHVIVVGGNGIILRRAFKADGGDASVY